ncbi:MAG: ABC transporter ATP-binding protein [Deltaproteobacteria bacterium]|nr:ABC transporter ATP-binding protein [Deltaproteobacteria bacterium]
MSLSLESVAKTYGRKVALERADLQVAAGEIVALVGPNGAGKSTTIGIATGQVIADTGRIRLGGKDLVAEPIEARRALGYLPQDPLLPRHLTGAELMRFVADVRSVPHDRVIALLDMALDRADHDRLIGELSAGTQRKLALAAALLGDPVALILDEPFAGLDVGAVARFEAEIRRRSAGGTAVLFSSHDLEGVTRLATRVVALRAGRVVGTLAGAQIEESALVALFGQDRGELGTD